MNNTQSQTEESWNDFNNWFVQISNYATLPHLIQIKQNYHPPVSKNIIQDGMYSKEEVIELLEKAIRDDAGHNISLDKFIQDNLK